MYRLRDLGSPGRYEMRSAIARLLVLVMFVCAGLVGIRVQQVEAGSSAVYDIVSSETIADKSDPSVYVIPIKGTIDQGLAGFLVRSLKEAQENQADAVILDIDTPGGFVDSAIKMRDSILAFDGKTIAYVDSRAWSAGALIAISCDDIGMKKGSSMGAAETRPKEEKYISAVRAEFESTAEQTSRDPKVAGAMVDADVEIPGLIEKGKILTLTARKAAEIGFAEYLVTDRNDLLDKVGLAGAVVHESKPTSGEWLARVLTSETASEILLTLGLVGIIVELLTPGWGVPGTVGVISLALFFGGRLMSGMAGWEVVVLFVVGFALLLVEVFIIPGFGVAGIVGIACIFTSLLLSYPTPAQAMSAMAIALVVTVVLVVLVIVFLSRRGKRPGGQGKIVLDAREDPAKGYVAVKRHDALVGERGVTFTPLRPVGTVQIGDARFDAMSEGGFVDRGQAIRVIAVEGNKIWVRPISDGEKE